MTLVELLICLAIIAVLIALVAPAIQYSRESARRTACRSQMRQVGLAVHARCEPHTKLPTSETAPWPIVLAPWFDQSALATQFDTRFDAFSSEPNARLGREPYPLLLCPSDHETRVDPWNWVAASKAFNAEFNGRALSDCADGLSQTILVAEVQAEHRLPWIAGPEKFVDSVESSHAGLFHVLLGDGSVRPLSGLISPELLHALATPRGGEPVAVP